MKNFLTSYCPGKKKIKIKGSSMEKEDLDVTQQQERRYLWLYFVIISYEEKREK